MADPPIIVADHDYIDTDVAYLLGMVFGRGQFTEDRDGRRLLITLDIRQRNPKPPPGIDPQSVKQMFSASPGVDLELENERALNRVRRRVNELLDAKGS